MPEGRGLRPFWSGTISFGLVTIPVGLYPATRSSAGISYRMLAPDGTPLSRQYICPEHGEAIDADEIVRGYETDDGRFVVVDDEELEGLAPEKSRDIDLRLFVDKATIPPLFFERPYFLTPASESTKAYRLLAAALEESGTAGIATFVLRGKEHVVAILSEGGILRAEILRFASEIRSPEDLELPEPGRVEKRVVDAYRKSIKKLTKKDIAQGELVDDALARVEKLAQRKLEKGEDVVEEREVEERTAKGADVIDLMEVLKRSLAGQKRAPGRSKPASNGDLSQASKEELYARAKKLDIAGRSSMTKRQLIRAIEKAS